MTRTVYLAGPITGCDVSEANDWRAYVIDQLRHVGIKGISPLRCEPLRAERYDLNYPDPKFGTPRAIGSKNIYDVRACDMTFAYLPAVSEGEWPSLGTIQELAWAHMIGKPTVLVSSEPRLIRHPVIRANAGWILPKLDDGIEVVIGVLADYVESV